MAWAQSAQVYTNLNCLLTSPRPSTLVASAPDQYVAPTACVVICASQKLTFLHECASHNVLCLR